MNNKDLHAVLKAVKDGYDYNPGSSDLDNEQPIHVSMTLGDYRKASRLLYAISDALATPQAAERGADNPQSGTSSRAYETLYPESRFVQAELIRGWFADALANSEITMKIVDNSDQDDLAYQMAALEDAGLVTFTRKSHDAAKKQKGGHS